jgi:tRNA (cytidine/uridine-2'-O-)-methyltransferase
MNNYIMQSRGKSKETTKKCIVIFFNLLGSTKMRLALFQPDIPQNTGTIIRLCACFNIPLDIIEPCGFVFSDTKLRRAGMDYHELTIINRHNSWDKFKEKQHVNRIVLVTTKATQLIDTFKFFPNDTLLFGSESSGVPTFVHETISNRVRVPISAPARSLNVAVCASIVLWEALRQESQSNNLLNDNQ